MKASSYIFILLFSTFSWAQGWKLIGTIELTEPVASVSIDTEGRIYLSSTLGSMQRMLPGGQHDEFFSDIANSGITLTEAWNKFKLFLFFRDLQKISVLDRFTTTPIEHDLSSYNTGYAWLATPGVDNSLWILSTDYNELRKYNIQSKQLLLSTPLAIDVNQATHIRAYQNLLIISDKTRGLYIFDQFGNLLRQLNAKGIQHFQVFDGKVIFLQEGLISIFDPFNAAVQEKIKAPEGAFESVLKTDQNYYLIQKNKVFIYERDL